MTTAAEHRGVVGWFAQNPVAANLLMLALLLGGVLGLLDIRQEITRDFTLEGVRYEEGQRAFPRFPLRYDTTIGAVKKDGPAYRAGIQRGDRSCLRSRSMASHIGLRPEHW